MNKGIMKKYSTLWTQFETQSLAFGLLRKALYPTYLVRGDYGKIEVYKATADKNHPIHVLTINVHASTKKEDDNFYLVEGNVFNLVGGESARNIVMKVLPELHARAEGGNAVPSPIES
jgi:hypothetical protein